MKKKSTFAPAPLVLCLTVAMSAGLALQLQAADVAAQHERISESMYKKQAAAVEQSRALAKKGKYEEAIRIMIEEVINPLKLEAADIDAWLARKLLVERSQELNNLQLTYGNLKLRDAENAIVQGRYNEAIRLANEARNINEELFNEKAYVVINAAQGKKNVSDKKEKTSATTTDPKIVEREARIRRLLDEAWVFFRNGRYDMVWKKVEEVYVLNPYNSEASYLASQAYKKYYQTGYKRRRADIQAQFAYEAWQWVEPVFPMKSENMGGSEEDTPDQVKMDSKIQNKLDAIRITEVKFEDREIDAVIQALREQSVRWDKDKEGVNIAFIQEKSTAKKVEENTENTAPGAGADNPAPPNAENEDEEDDWDEDNPTDEPKDTKNDKKSDSGIKVTLHLKDVTLRQLLNYVSYLTDMPYVIREDRVVFGMADNDLLTKKYKIYDSVKKMIAGKQVDGGAAAEDAGDAGDAGDVGDVGDAGDVGGGDAAGNDAGGEGGAAPAAAAPAAPAAPSIEVDEKDLTPEALQNFFTLYGVTFPEGSSISYFKDEVQMRNTAENHRHIAEQLKALNVENPMIEVEVKSIELTENDMEELGFTWALGVIKNNKVTVQKGSNTSVDGEGAVLKMLDGLLSGVDSRIVSNLNIFPDIFGSFKPFGIDESFNLTLTINALDRSDRTEQISAPRVLVAHEVQARVKMTKAYFFPEDWEELEIETEEVGDNGDMSVNITPPSPEFSETEEDIGTVFTVTPSIYPGNKVINLKLNPKITAYTGKDEAEVVVLEERRDGPGSEWNQTVHRFTVWRPVIATREVKVDIDLNHGETMVIAGLSDSSTQKRMDRIPILSDIPFIGRLFQTQSEISVRRNMLIFVTARLVNNDGIPLPRTENLGNGGIPMLSR